MLPRCAAALVLLSPERSRPALPCSCGGRGLQVPTSHGKADLTIYRQAGAQVRAPEGAGAREGRARCGGGGRGGGVPAQPKDPSDLRHRSASSMHACMHACSWLAVLHGHG